MESAARGEGGGGEASRRPHAGSPGETLAALIVATCGHLQRVPLRHVAAYVAELSGVLAGVPAPLGSAHGAASLLDALLLSTKDAPQGEPHGAPATSGDDEDGLAVVLREATDAYLAGKGE